MPFTLSSVPYHCFCCFLCLELLSPCLLNCFLTLRKQVAQCLKNLPARAADARDEGSILGSVRSPGGGNDNPLQYSYLESPLDKEAWWATIHGVTESWTQLTDWAYASLTSPNSPLKFNSKSHPHLLERDTMEARYTWICIPDFLLLAVWF